MCDTSNRNLSTSRNSSRAPPRAAAVPPAATGGHGRPGGLLVRSSRGTRRSGRSEHCHLSFCVTRCGFASLAPLTSRGLVEASRAFHWAPRAFRWGASGVSLGSLEGLGRQHSMTGVRKRHQTFFCAHSCRTHARAMFDSSVGAAMLCSRLGRIVIGQAPAPHAP